MNLTFQFIFRIFFRAVFGNRLYITVFIVIKDHNKSVQSENEQDKKSNEIGNKYYIIHNFLFEQPYIVITILKLYQAGYLELFFQSLLRLHFFLNQYFLRKDNLHN